LVGEGITAKSKIDVQGDLLLEDVHERPVALFRSEWAYRSVVEKNPKVKFLAVPPRGVAEG
jgi:hypothetical protein